MAFESLSEKLSAAFKRLRNKGKFVDVALYSVLRGERTA